MVKTIRKVKVSNRMLSKNRSHSAHEDYKNCLFTGREQLRNMNVIRSHLHEMYTEEVNKIALSADDDKRIIMKDNISTLAYGHYKSNQQ